MFPEVAYLTKVSQMQAYKFVGYNYTAVVKPART